MSRSPSSPFQDLEALRARLQRQSQILNNPARPPNPQELRELRDLVTRVGALSLPPLKSASNNTLSLNYTTQNSQTYITSAVQNSSGVSTVPFVWNPNPTNASNIVSPLVVTANPVNFLPNLDPNAVLAVDGELQTSGLGSFGSLIVSAVTTLTGALTAAAGTFSGLLTANNGLTINGVAGLIVGGNSQLGGVGAAYTTKTAHNTLDDGSGKMTLNITDTSTSYADFNVLKPNLATYQATVANVGQSGTTGNAAQLTHYYAGNNNAGNYLSLGLVSGPNSIQITQPGVIKSKNNVYDDNTGNMSIAGYIRSSVPSSSAYPHYGFSSILSSDSQVGNNIGIYCGPGASIGLNASSGGVYTLNQGSKRNILDDGSGGSTVANMNVVGSLNVGTPGNNNVGISQFQSGGNGIGYTYIYGAKNNTGYTPYVFNYNTVNGYSSPLIITSSPSGSGSGSVYARAGGNMLFVDGPAATVHNILEDGSGNMTVAGNATVGGTLTVNGTSGMVVGYKLQANSGVSYQNGSFATTVSASTLSANNSLSLPTSSGTLALTPSSGSYVTTTTLDNSTLPAALTTLNTTGATNLGSTLNVQGMQFSTDLTNSYIQQTNGTAGTLYLNHSGGSVQTQHVVVDDGNGNMSLHGSSNPLAVYGTDNGVNSGQIVTLDSSHTTYQLAMGISSSQNCGVIQATNTGTAYIPLILNKNGGSVQTRNSTLDDSTGKMTLNITDTGSSFTDFNVLKANVAAGNYTVLNLGQGVGPNNACQLAFIYNGNNNASNRVSLGMPSSANKLVITQPGVISTANSTLDDGSGNMTVNGNKLSWTDAPLKVVSSYTPTGSNSGGVASFFAPNAGIANSQVGIITGTGAASGNGAQLNWNYANSSNTMSMGPLTATVPFGSLSMYGSPASLYFQSGRVATQNSTLDDGSGNMVLAGGGTAQYFTSTGNGTATMPTFSGGQRITLGVGGGAGNITGVIQTSTNSTVSNLPMALQAKSVVTWDSTGALRSVLDDGLGNMTVAGTASATTLSGTTVSATTGGLQINNGSGTIAKIAYSPSAGGTQTFNLSGSGGTIALTSQIPTVINNWISLNATNPSAATTLAYSTFANSASTTITVSGSSINCPTGTYDVIVSLHCNSVPASTSFEVQIAPQGSSTSTGVSRSEYYNSQGSVANGSGNTFMTVTFSAASSLVISITGPTATNSITGIVKVTQVL